MLTADGNLRLFEEIDANRRFLLLAYSSNPALLAKLDEKERLIAEASLGASEVGAVAADPACVGH